MVQAGNIVAPEGNLPAGHFFQTLGHFFQSRQLFGKKFPGDRVIGLFQQSVDDQLLAADAQFGQFPGGPVRFQQRGPVRTGYQEQGGTARVRQGFHGLPVQGFPAFQAGQLSQTGGTMGTSADELAPGRRQLEHPQSMAGRGRIKKNLVIGRCGFRIRKEIRKGIEGGDFDGTGTGQLFFHVPQGSFRQKPPVGSHHAFPVGGCGLYRIQVGCFQAVDTGNGSGCFFQFQRKDVLEIGGRVRTDQQYLLTGIGQGHRRGTGCGSLSHPAFAGKEHILGPDGGKRIIQFHIGLLSSLTAAGRTGTAAGTGISAVFFFSAVAGGFGSRFFTATAAAGTGFFRSAVLPGRGFVQQGRIKIQHPGEFFIGGVTAGHPELSICQDQGQFLRSMVLQEFRCRRGLDEFEGRIAQIVPFHQDAVFFQRVQYRRDPQQFRIDGRTAKSCRAAHGLFKNLYLFSFHNNFLPKK